MDPSNKQVSETFDAYESKYADAVNDAVSFSGLDVDFFTRVKADYIVDIARKTFGTLRGLRLVDVGCGIGNFHPLLSRAFDDITGVDVSTASIERARSANPGVSYSSYDGGLLPFDDASFDIAMAVCVVHHVPPVQWPDFMSEFRRVLKPGGLALVFEHNPLNPLSVHVVNNCPFDEDAVLLRAPELKKLFASAGFFGVEDRFILSVPAFNSAFRSLDRVFSRLPFGAQYYVSARK